MPTIILPNPKKHITPKFSELYKEKSRYLLCWGGRGGGKSANIARIYVYRALTEDYFKCLLIRKVYNTIRQSIYEEIKQAIFDLGLEEFFTFRVAPLEIECQNGNIFLARGLDEPQKLKSIKDPSCAIYEEANEISETDFNTVTTSIRTTKADFLQEVLLFNPETPTHYEDFWLWQYFFKGQPTKDFSGKFEYEDREITFRSVHSTYLDNPYLSADMQVFLQNLKEKNPYYFTVWALGEWGTRDVQGRFYRSFTLENTCKNVDVFWQRPLHITYDFNVIPYVTLNVWQLQEDGRLVQVDELCAPEPDNTTKRITEIFCEKYSNPLQEIYVYGDPAGKHRDTRSEKGVNDYSIIFAELKKHFREVLNKVQNKAYNVSQRGLFINHLFDTKQITISERCRNTIADYQNLQTDKDGTKLKRTIADKQTGLRYEEYGHTSDANDYLLTKYFEREYEDFMNPYRKTVASPLQRLNAARPI